MAVGGFALRREKKFLTLHSPAVKGNKTNARKIEEWAESDWCAENKQRSNELMKCCRGLLRRSKASSTWKSELFLVAVNNDSPSNCLHFLPSLLVCLFAAAAAREKLELWEDSSSSSFPFVVCRMEKFWLWHMWTRCFAINLLRTLLPCRFIKHLYTESQSILIRGEAGEAALLRGHLGSNHVWSRMYSDIEL